MRFAWFRWVTSQEGISTASCSDPTGLLEYNSLLRCDSVSDERVTGEGLLAIVKISEEKVYIVMGVEVAAVKVASVVVTATGVESRHIATVVVVKDASTCMA